MQSHHDLPDRVSASWGQWDQAPTKVSAICKGVFSHFPDPFPGKRRLKPLIATIPPHTSCRILSWSWSFLEFDLHGALQNDRAIRCRTRCLVRLATSWLTKYHAMCVIVAMESQYRKAWWPLRWPDCIGRGRVFQLRNWPWLVWDTPLNRFHHHEAPAERRPMGYLTGMMGRPRQQWKVQFVGESRMQEALTWCPTRCTWAYCLNLLVFFLADKVLVQEQQVQVVEFEGGSVESKMLLNKVVDVHHASILGGLVDPDLESFRCQ